MKHSGENEDFCPVAQVAALLGDVCTLLIVRDLLREPKRFKDLADSLSPISTRTIVSKLKLLEEKHLVTRHEFKEKPPRVEYELTKEGKKLGPLLNEMRTLGTRWKGTSL